MTEINSLVPFLGGVQLPLAVFHQSTVTPLVLPERWLSHLHLHLYFNKARMLVLSCAVQVR